MAPAPAPAVILTFFNFNGVAYVLSAQLKISEVQGQAIHIWGQFDDLENVHPLFQI